MEHWLHPSHACDMLTHQNSVSCCMSVSSWYVFWVISNMWLQQGLWLSHKGSLGWFYHFPQVRSFVIQVTSCIRNRSPTNIIFLGMKMWNHKECVGFDLLVSFIERYWATFYSKMFFSKCFIVPCSLKYYKNERLISKHSSWIWFSGNYSVFSGLCFKWADIPYLRFLLTIMSQLTSLYFPNHWLCHIGPHTNNCLFGYLLINRVLKIVCKYVYACTMNIYWSLPKYSNCPIFYSCSMKCSPTTEMKPYLLCMHSCNIFTTYHLYAVHRRLCCSTTIKNKKDNLKRSVFPALTAKMCKEWFSFEKGQYNPQFWNALKINKKLKNLIFDRERLFLKKLIYSIMPQRDYPATKVQIYKTLERVLGLEQQG